MENDKNFKIAHDPVIEGFRLSAAEDALAINHASAILQLTADPASGSPPSRYGGVLKDVEHLVVRPDKTVAVSSEPVLFSVDFPDDYCRSTDSSLGFRVVRIHSELMHPNINGAAVCLGERFRPATRLRAIVFRLYQIVSGRSFATSSPFDADAASYYRTHLEQVHALVAPPLWREASGARVVAADAPNDAAGVQP